MRACWNALMGMVEMSNDGLISEQDYREGHDKQKDGYSIPFEFLPSCRDGGPSKDEVENEPNF